MDKPPLPEGENNGQDALLPFPDWITDLNQQLASAAASAAEQAFGRGCSFSLAPMGFVMVIIFLLGVRHWVSLMLAALAVSMLAIAWAIFAALQAQSNSPRRLWQERLRAEVESGLARRGQSQAQLIQTAQELLPENAPLRRALRGEFE